MVSVSNINIRKSFLTSQESGHRVSTPRGDGVHADIRDKGDISLSRNLLTLLAERFLDFFCLGTEVSFSDYCFLWDNGVAMTFYSFLQMTYRRLPLYPIFSFNERFGHLSRNIAKRADRISWSRAVLSLHHRYVMLVLTLLETVEPHLSPLVVTEFRYWLDWYAGVSIWVFVLSPGLLKGCL